MLLELRIRKNLKRNNIEIGKILSNDKKSDNEMEQIRSSSNVWYFKYIFSNYNFLVAVVMEKNIR